MNVWDTRFEIYQISRCAEENVDSRRGNIVGATCDLFITLALAKNMMRKVTLRKVKNLADHKSRQKIRQNELCKFEICIIVYKLKIFIIVSA